MNKFSEPAEIVLRKSVDLGSVHDISLAINDLSQFFRRITQDGKFLYSSLSVVRHVVEEEGLSSDEALRLLHLLDDVDAYHENQIANVRSFRRTFLEQQIQDKLVGETDPTRWPFSWIDKPLENQESQDLPEEQLVYWRTVRDSLTRWFALPLDKLSVTLGISYATFANLGKRRPQGRTIRPILGLYSLAKACIDIGREDARLWLASKGRDLLLVHGFSAFEQAANERLFKGADLSRSAIAIEEGEDASITSWLPPSENTTKRSERF